MPASRSATCRSRCPSPTRCWSGSAPRRSIAPTSWWPPGISTVAVGGKGARIGLECAGEVEAVGSEVEGIKPGDRVMGSAPGAHAEYVVTDYVRLHRIPANNMTFAQAACFPVALQTMHNAIVTAGRFERGESC